MSKVTAVTGASPFWSCCGGVSVLVSAGGFAWQTVHCQGRRVRLRRVANGARHGEGSVSRRGVARRHQTQTDPSAERGHAGDAASELQRRLSSTHSSNRRRLLSTRCKPATNCRPTATSAGGVVLVVRLAEAAS
ncbi:hypothetical protein PF010_g7113 [Phytophthora fragariae]|uniref:Uncharacterized protein n=1 Tax=Phytophthora fragariae TaxID=53985 RepID=A0A6G0LIP7_9STRA|nr:hypothetical protein PF010_g7113 [Phytophthora fragariae]KAE9351316.1 hypothetical protein PF008_g6003 [Phytophthora fragariae]